MTDKKPSSKLIRFRRDYFSQTHEVQLTLGDELEVSIGNKTLHCKFIKVTSKGFNILNLDTDRTILKHHLYGKGMGGKEYPAQGRISKIFRIPNCFHVRVIKKQKTS